MKDKKIFKKWWFWLIVAIIVLGVIGSQGQSNSEDQTDPISGTQESTDSALILPKLNTDEYKNKEGLVVYKELKDKGYKVDANFENQALTDINGKASDLFEKLDVGNTEDRKSVDAYVVSKLIQNGDSVSLSVILQPTR